MFIIVIIIFIQMVLIHIGGADLLAEAKSPGGNRPRALSYKEKEVQWSKEDDYDA